MDPENLKQMYYFGHDPCCFVSERIVILGAEYEIRNVLSCRRFH